MSYRSIILVMALLVCLLINIFAQPYEGEKGDVNNTGDINVLDIIVTANYILGIDPLDEQELWRADCNSYKGSCRGDDNVDMLDAVKIASIILGLDKCPELLTDIDGNVYETVTIGSQVWMSENLKVTHYRQGDAIPNVTDNTDWDNLTSGAYCEYNNDVGNVGVYGRLYNWYAVHDSRNIAPEGWHVSTDAEWKQLEIYLGMSQWETDVTGWRGTDEGDKMRETGTAHWNCPNTRATNESGFTALPGGNRLKFFNGNFKDLGSYAFFWSSTEANSSLAWFRYLSCYEPEVYRNRSSKQDGFSVRCIKE